MHPTLGLSLRAHISFYFTIIKYSCPNLDDLYYAIFLEQVENLSNFGQLNINYLNMGKIRTGLYGYLLFILFMRICRLSLIMKAALSFLAI